MDGTLYSRATKYAAGQYEAQRVGGRGGNRAMCVHFGSGGYWCLSHEHATIAEAFACRDERRAACVSRIIAAGGHSEL